MGIGNLMQALGAGLQSGIMTARRVYEDPASAHQQKSFTSQAQQYSLLWAYYSNSVFDRMNQTLNSQQMYGNSPYPLYPYNPYSGYKSNYNLYRNIRPIYNPTRRLVDFYAGSIYPGVLSEDGKMLPDGVSLAIPFAEDTPKPLKDAIAQFWQWSNWQSKKALQVRYGGALGSTLIEIVDDVEQGKVTADVVWPGFVYDLELDGAGNVKAYALQYSVRDEKGENYVYGKEVDTQVIRYYKDHEPFDYGTGSVVEHPYGFCPAVWIKHMDVGGSHGSPAMSGSMGKIDELNNLASHVHDQIHKVIGAPVVMWTSSPVTNLFKTQKRGITNENDTPQAAEEESLLMLKGGPDGHVDSLAGELNLGDASAYMLHLISEIEQDHPELVMYKELRNMSQVTGPGASRIVGDTTSRVTEVGATYDNANMSLFRMVVAIAGFRANSGAWGPLNRQQEKFKPFNLDSYAKGDLDMVIMPRPLLVPTKSELANEQMLLWQGAQMAVAAGVPLEFVLQEAGFTDEQLALLKTQMDAAKAEAKQQQADALQLAQAQQPPQQSDNQQAQDGTQPQQNGAKQA